MTYNYDVSNTFISDEGEMMFVESWELSCQELSNLAKCERMVELIEKKYGTDDIGKMLEHKNANRKEVVGYIDARRMLIAYGRYKRYA